MDIVWVLKSRKEEQGGRQELTMESETRKNDKG